MRAASKSDLSELERNIEAVVQGHLAEVRQRLQMAVERALSSVSHAPRPVASRPPSRRAGTRRSAQSLAQLSDSLYEQVLRHPGDAMPTFARAIGVTVRELHRPMALLRSAGRIRSTGLRQAMRYFPTTAGR